MERLPPVWVPIPRYLGQNSHPWCRLCSCTPYSCTSIYGVLVMSRSWARLTVWWWRHRWGHGSLRVTHPQDWLSPTHLVCSLLSPCYLHVIPPGSTGLLYPQVSRKCADSTGLCLLHSSSCRPVFYRQTDITCVAAMTDSLPWAFCFDW